MNWHHPERVVDSMSIAPAVGMPGAPTTSADGLRQRIADMENRLRERPHDGGAAVLLADALLRQGRVTGDGHPAARAAEVLRIALEDNPGSYDALRLLGAIDLSQHKFRDALDVGRRARDLRPGDAWNYGVIGDALIELGEYDQAFDAIDTMARLRPTAGAYARVAYARELCGDLPGALHAMQLAASATASRDPEAQAWYASQLGELYLRMGRLDDAEREYRRASFMFPDYLLAMVGQGKVMAAKGKQDEALAIYLQQLRRTPTVDLASRIGDLYAGHGDTAQAEHYYQLAEDLAGPPIAQTDATLVLFLAEHDRKLPDALTLGKSIAAMRSDIFTEDALAWTYYKTGRLKEAFSASRRALRTGTRDSQILRHAAEIEHAYHATS